jgi:hypothetical protein
MEFVAASERQRKPVVALADCGQAAGWRLHSADLDAEKLSGCCCPVFSIGNTR